jgi:hypothetical protein
MMQARDVASEIVAILGRGARKARFVTEVADQLARANVNVDLLDYGLEELEASGQALVREQYCGDPHLAGADLRIVALIQPQAEGNGQQDARSRANDDIEAIWERWLMEYLSNHRCG